MVFPGRYQRNSMQNFQDLIKITAEFPGLTNNNPVQFPGLLVGPGMNFQARSITQFCRIPSCETFSPYLDFQGVK